MRSLLTRLKCVPRVPLNQLGLFKVVCLLFVTPRLEGGFSKGPSDFIYAMY